MLKSRCELVPARRLAGPRARAAYHHGRMRLRHLLAGAVLPLVLCASLWLVLPLGSEAQAPQGRAASLQKKIETTRGKIGRRKGTERVLTSDIQRWSSKITRLQGSISK